MSIRHLFSRLGLCLSLLAVPFSVRSLRADEPAAPEVANSNFSTQGIVTADGALIRSGPGDNYYPTLKLAKGQKVMVVGIKYDWLKIVPPEGSFCYVAKAHVERLADANTGRVTVDGVIVRAGSALNTLKITPVTQLSTNTEVTILGEEDEYYKISPPAGAYLYVDKNSVTPDAQSKPVAQTIGAPAAKAGVGAGDTPAATQAADIRPPTTRPVEELAIDALFEKTEERFTKASTKPLDEQPLAELIECYQHVDASTYATATMKRNCEIRLNTLRVRQQAAVEYAAVIKDQQQLEHKEAALNAERQELEERLRTTGVMSYTAVGELQPSSLQSGPEMLYRLTDPADGHTLCYVRSGDAQYPSFFGQFVGVKGELTTDEQLGVRILTASGIAQVDPAKVNDTVAALLIPPSILARGAATQPAATVEDP